MCVLTTSSSSAARRYSLRLRSLNCCSAAGESTLRSVWISVTSFARASLWICSRRAFSSAQLAFDTCRCPDIDKTGRFSLPIWSKGGWEAQTCGCEIEVTGPRFCASSMALSRAYSLVIVSSRSSSSAF